MKKGLHSSIKTFTVKHGGGSFMVWACFVEQLAFIDGTMDSELYHQVVKDNVRTSVHELILKRAMQHGNNPKLY